MQAKIINISPALTLEILFFFIFIKFHVMTYSNFPHYKFKVMAKKLLSKTNMLLRVRRQILLLY